jgi:hypothetical protein
MRDEFDFLMLDESEIQKKHLPSHRRFLAAGGYEVLRRLDKLVLYERSSR